MFDRLLKACNEVVWQDQSIIVLNHIHVDPPYTIENCKLLAEDSGATGHDEKSLERVKNIVAAASV